MTTSADITIRHMGNFEVKARRIGPIIPVSEYLGKHFEYYIIGRSVIHLDYYIAQ